MANLKEMVQSSEGGSLLKKGAIIGGIVILALILKPFTLISAGHRGVVTNLGAVSDRVLGEGFNFKVPIYQTVVEMNVQVQKAKATAQAASRDLQTVETTIAVNYHIDPAHVNHLYQNVGADYEATVIDPAILETVKAVTANYTAEQLITNRQNVSLEIQKNLADRLKPFFLFVDAISVENFNFSEKFNEAIESKQQAEQMALKAQRDLERIRTEAEQQITTARAQAEAYRLQTQTLTPLMRDMEWIKKWDGKLPNYYGSANPLLSIH
ncbi:MAG TPA: prohibitin family protein [Leptospiraceae bacterium]|jgi:regulator of protease activity HflC (stomatin/prohibitin superfamily)|nr:prohibitin family protein [Leptospiraceae bacterium]HMY45005.1 prohibitin family protein [Leptospiraceae bacterium]HNJ34809.1 prohibitin family protein [Leptospiraceae bacterium]HNL68057.1 prohibitin family protein [Leptospiraceae bacterium]HNN59045.1 prohibitin family protein [Leptospiraceae bacterium]